MNDIDTLVKAIDRAPHTPEQGPGARELRAAIMATLPPPASRLPRRFRRARGVLSLSAVTALAAAVAIVLGLPSRGPATRYANAAVSITKATGYFSVTITDPAADRRRFEEAFRAVGLNVTVKVVPVAPGAVGTLIGPIVPGGFQGPGSVGVRRVPCSSAFCGKVWLPSGLSQRVVFGVGRPARPGEPYVEDHFYDPSGEEALAGFTTHGKTVAAVRDELRHQGLKIGYRLLWTRDAGARQTEYTDQAVPASRIKDDWIVNGCRYHSSDTVDVYVVPGPGAGPMPHPVATPQWYDQ